LKKLVEVAHDPKPRRLKKPRPAPVIESPREDGGRYGLPVPIPTQDPAEAYGSLARRHRPVRRDGRTFESGEPWADPHEICTILYEDEHLLVVNKSSGFPVHPAGSYLHRTVLHALRALGYKDVNPAHRLDRETSGVLVFTRTVEASRRLRRIWRSDKCIKEYEAICEGDVPGGFGRISLPIGLDLASPVHIRRAVRPIEEGGRVAVTEWRLVARGRGLTRLRLRLRTGRCHQIRVHLAAIGHPIVGDKIYGGDSQLYIRFISDAMTEADRERLRIQRHALHCTRIAFPHPISGDQMDFCLPMPQELLLLMPGAWVIDPAQA